MAEIIRRFFYYSVLPYLLADIIFILITIISYKTLHSINIAYILRIFLIYIIWGVFCLTLNQASPFLIIVGLRPFILALCAFIIASSYFKTGSNPIKTLLNITIFWVVVTCSIAILQIYLGIDAGINQLPDEVSSSLGGGRGDFVAGNGELMVEGLFRPTSIFMHTGRYGQFTFISSIFLISYVMFTNKTSTWYKLATFITFINVILSGQRSSLFFLVIGILFMLFYLKNLKSLFTIIIGVSFITIISALFISEDLQSLLIFRFGSAFTESSSRASEQGGALIDLMDYFLLLGKGIGYFTFGSIPFNGEIFYEFVAELNYIGGENSWLRILGETGLIGLILFGFIVFLLIIQCISNIKKNQVVEENMLHFTAAYSLIAISIWGLTHDVFSNYLMLIFVFFYIGASNGSKKIMLKDKLEFKDS
jgi:O-antigen ligase